MNERVIVTDLAKNVLILTKQWLRLQTKARRDIVQLWKHGGLNFPFRSGAYLFTPTNFIQVNSSQSRFEEEKWTNEGGIDCIDDDVTQSRYFFCRQISLLQTKKKKKKPTLTFIFLTKIIPRSARSFLGIRSGQAKKSNEIKKKKNQMIVCWIFNNSSTYTFR